MCIAVLLIGSNILKYAPESDTGLFAGGPPANKKLFAGGPLANKNFFPDPFLSYTVVNGPLQSYLVFCYSV